MNTLFLQVALSKPSEQNNTTAADRRHGAQAQAFDRAKASGVVNPGMCDRAFWVSHGG